MSRRGVRPPHRKKELPSSRGDREERTPDRGGETPGKAPLRNSRTFEFRRKYGFKLVLRINAAKTRLLMQFSYLAEGISTRKSIKSERIQSTFLPCLPFLPEEAPEKSDSHRDAHAGKCETQLRVEGPEMRGTESEDALGFFEGDRALAHAAGGIDHARGPRVGRAGDGDPVL